MSDPLVVWSGVDLAYDGRPAVRELSLRAEAGELLAVAGPNGSGKSSLFRAAVGLETPERGEVRVRGQPIVARSILDRARDVAWMPQDEPAGDNVSVREYVAYGRHPLAGGSRSDDGLSVSAALGLVDLGSDGDRGVWELSGGERQRARLARVLVQSTPVVLLDEPTAHLDIGHALATLARLRELARAEHRAIVVALHDLNLAARFADRIAVMSRGRLLADGAPSAVLSPTLLAEVWGISAELRTDKASGLPYLLPRLPALAPPPQPRRRVHVVAGGGSGLQTLRLLVDAGFEVTAGTLPLFDSDSELAEELHVPSVVELPFAPISEDARARTRAFVAAADVVVVAPLAVAPGNLPNLLDLLDLDDPGKLRLLAHPAGLRWDFADGAAETTWAELRRRGGRELGSADELLRDLATPGAPAASNSR